MRGREKNMKDSLKTHCWRRAASAWSPAAWWVTWRRRSRPRPWSRAGDDDVRTLIPCSFTSARGRGKDAPRCTHSHTHSHKACKRMYDETRAGCAFYRGARTTKRQWCEGGRGCARARARDTRRTSEHYLEVPVLPVLVLNLSNQPV